MYGEDPQTKTLQECCNGSPSIGTEGICEPNVAQTIADGLVITGQYECLLYTGNSKNNWHYVTISEEGQGSFLWTNRAGRSWALYQD